MADLNYRVDIDTKAAERSLDGLKNVILGFSSAIAGAFATKEITMVAARFQDLRTTLELLYRDAAKGNAVFEDIKQFAATTAFSVESLTDTVVKLKAAGLDPTIAQLRLFADVSTVASDSVGALQAITDLYARTTAGGLGLEDLNRLADRGIPVFSILSERLGLSRLEISKVGQTAEGAAIILKALEDGLNQAFGGATSARANNVSQAISNFGDTVANVGDILGRAGYNEGLTKLINAVGDMLSQMRPLAAAIGYVLGGALEILAENIKLVAVAFAGFFAIVTVSAIMRIAQAFTLFNAVLGKNPIVKVLTFLAGAGAALFGLTQATDEFTQQWDELNKKLDEGPKTVPGLSDGSLATNTENLRGQIQNLNDELNRFKAEMASVSVEFARYNQQTINSINLETSLIGISTEIARIRRSEAEITQRAADEVQRLQLAKAKLSAEERKQGRAAIIDEEIKKIQQQAEIDKKATAAAITNSEARTNARQLELFGIRRQIDVFEDLQKIQDDIAKSTLSELERKYYDIDAAARQSARSAIQAEEARRGSPLNTEEVKRYYEEALKGSERLKKSTREQYEQSRTFSAGWRKAFREYIDAASNAALQAERIFAKFTSGLEDLIVNFAKTGKFEWKEFVASMTEELLRSQVRQLIGNVMGAFGMGDLFGGGGGAGGVGGTPTNPMYVYDVSSGGVGGAGGLLGGAAGQQGGGIMGALGNVWNGIKNVGSSIWDGVTGVVGGIGSAIGGVVDTVGGWFGGDSGGGGGFLDSITSGISDFFGGFFANGGSLPAGKFGIVGERGPEMITGPANITPMGGSVTYNINAVDAASFKALVAADPGFIHAVAMQGASSIPMRR